MLGRDLLAVSFLRWMPQPLLDLRYEPLGGSQIPDGMVRVLRLTAPKNRMMLLSVPLAKGDGSQVCSGLAAGGNRIRTFGPSQEMSPIRTVGVEIDVGRRKPRFLYGGTDGSNPVPSSAESLLNHRSKSRNSQTAAVHAMRVEALFGFDTNRVVILSHWGSPRERNCS
jgi:hypothetical protein